MIAKRAYFLIAIFLHGMLGSVAQFNTEQLSVAEGLSQSQVFALEEDQFGNIWMGTQGGGICSFDGFDFTCYGTQDGLPDGYVNCLALSVDNRLLVGTRKGLAQFNGTTFTTISLPEPTSVICLERDSLGAIWIGSNRGLFRLQDGVAERVAQDLLPEGTLIDDIAFDSYGAMWVATAKGLYRNQDDSWARFGEEEGFRSEIVTSIQVCGNGELFAGTYGEGLYQFGEGEFLQVLPDRRAVVLTMLEDEEGSLWVGTLDSGLWVKDRGRDDWRNINEEKGLPANHVRSLLTDSWGNLWIGTSGAGAARYRGQEFEHVDRNRGLPGKQVYSIAQVGADRWALGVGDQGLWYYKPQAEERFTQDSVLTSGKVKALAVDRFGKLWAGGEGLGIYVYSSDTSLFLGRNQGLQSLFINDLEPQQDGSVLIATSGGGLSIAKPYGKGGFGYFVSTYTRAQGMPDDRIPDVVRDVSGRTWFATQSNGLGVMVEDNIVAFDLEDGLTSNAVKSLTIDDYDRLWIGTQDAGLCSIDLTEDTLRIEQASFNQDLISGNVYSLLSDGSSHVWLGSEKGMSRLEVSQEGVLIEATHFGPEDGFLGIEATSNAAIQDDKGRLWFGTIDGFNIARPNEDHVNELPPRLSVTEIRLFYTPLRETHLSSFLGDWNVLSKDLVLTYEQNSVGFDFKGINQARPTGVRYRWRLKGYEDDWSPISDKRSISYSNLSPGSYTFEVEAVNEDGVWTFMPERINFEILSPFWQELWFKLAVALTIALLLGLIVWLRLRRIKARSRERNDRLKLENSILELEQKALRLQMNPHFIFNTLNSIQGLIARKDAKTARLYLSKFSRLMRLNLENSREELVTLEQELEALRYFLDLEQFTHEDRFEYEIESLIDPEEWMVPPLVIQPFTENAIIHGLLPQEGKGKLTIRCRERLGALEVEISDNGIGRKASAERNQNRQGHRSTGLEVTQERLNLLQQNGNQRDTVQFKDILDENGKALGTSVFIHVNQPV